MFERIFVASWFCFSVLDSTSAAVHAQFDVYKTDKHAHTQSQPATMGSSGWMGRQPPTSGRISSTSSTTIIIVDSGSSCYQPKLERSVSTLWEVRSKYLRALSHASDLRKKAM